MLRIGVALLSLAVILPGVTLGCSEDTSDRPVVIPVDASAERAPDTGISAEASQESGKDTSGESAPEVLAPEEGGWESAIPESDAPQVPPILGNALLLPEGGVTPLYPITDPEASSPKVAYLKTADGLQALDATGTVLWEKSIGEGQLFGGFDFDRDGWPDLGLVRSQDSGKMCGSSPILLTSIDLVKGRTAELFSPIAALESKCWTFGTTTYPTSQWTVLAGLFGAGTGTLAFSPYYAADGSFLEFQGGAFQSTATFLYPSTSTYDSTYAADQSNAHGQGHSYEENCHVANGLVLPVGGEQRLVFFTSARVAQFRIAPLSASQLAADTPFLTANRTDLVGRNYGLVVSDLGDPNRVVLVSGTSVWSLYQDMCTATMEADPWGQIERHLTVYTLEPATVEDRFFSYAHDNNDGNKYEGRVAYPNNPIVRRGASVPSRYAFNVYEAGHWMLHVTQPGSTLDAVVFKDWVLWDIQDLEQDGEEEWVLSPSRDPTDPDTSGWYFTKWRTVLARWNESSLKFDEKRTIEGAIPYLVGAFREPLRTTSFGFLYPVLTVGREQGLDLLLMDGQKQVQRIGL